MQFYLVGRKGRAVIRRNYPNADRLQMFDTTDVREPGYAEAARSPTTSSPSTKAGEFDVAHLFFSKFRSRTP